MPAGGVWPRGGVAPEGAIGERGGGCPGGEPCFCELEGDEAGVSEGLGAVVPVVEIVAVDEVMEVTFDAVTLAAGGSVEDPAWSSTVGTSWARGAPSGSEGEGGAGGNWE